MANELSTTRSPTIAYVIMDLAVVIFFGSPPDVINLMLPQTRRKRAVVPAKMIKERMTFLKRTGTQLNDATPLTEQASILLAYQIIL